MLGIVFLNIYSVIAFFIMRYFMDINFISNAESSFYADDVAKMYKIGFLYDLRASSIAFIVLILLVYISKIFSKIGNGGGSYRIIQKIYYLYSFFILLILSFFAFIGFYYYETYKSRIDIFIFNFFYDDTVAATKIILNDYPIFTAFVVCFAFSFLGVKICKIINKIDFKIHFGLKIILNIVFLLCYFLALRGSVGTFPLGEKGSKISNLASINHISTNPLLALAWAKKHHDNSSKFYKVDPKVLKENYENLFNESIIKTTPKNEFLVKNPPHVVFNLMESFGINYLMLDSANRDFLVSLRKHFKSDFVFTRFLSAHNGTAPSFAGIFYLSPYANIAFSTQKTKKLELTPFDVYKKAGYEVVFITSANTSWQNLDEYLQVLGVDKIYDMHTLIKDFPEAKGTINPYGVADEFIYKKALNVLNEAKKPTFISILTTSNHPPFFIPQHFKENIEFSDEFFKNFTNDSEIFRKNSARVAAYSNDSFGKFLDELKALKIGEKTIVAASGDHKNRDLKQPSSDYLINNYAVPFYIYVPKDYQKDIYYDSFRPASHKDIFPTLYELSLSEQKYLNLGGRNILKKVDNPKLEFGINDGCYIDERQIFNTFSSFDFTANEIIYDGFTIKNQNKTQANDNDLNTFFTNYQKIYYDEMNYRLDKNYKEYELY